MMSRILSVCSLAVVLATVSTGCTFDEGIVIENMVGTVVIPGELIERTYENSPDPIRDVRAIGPVYLGLYSGAVGAELLETYPYPSTGPLFDTALGVGDTYPYGGTTIGTMRSTCLEALQCKMISGRYKTYDELIEWFRDYLGDPILDWYGEPIDSGEELRQLCFSTFNYSTDDELGMVVVDENKDGVINEADLDFQLREDGNFEADFTLWQQEYFTDPEGEKGFTLWGFVDSPAPGANTFGSCIQGGLDGENINSYNQDFQAGVMKRNILNRPSDSIDPGDIVSGVQDQDGGAGTIGYVYEDVYDIPELWLNFKVQ